MRTSHLACLAIFCKLLAASTPGSLAAELRQLSAEVDRGNVPGMVAALPPAWSVDTDSGPQSVSTRELRRLLSEDPAEAKAWMVRLAGLLESYDDAAAPPADARAKLDRILARREFRGAEGPSVLELWRQRVAEWVQEMLAKLFRNLGIGPAGAAIFFWVFLAGVVGTLGYLLIRLWLKDAISGVAPREPVVRGRTAHDWLRSARAAAAAGDWRLGIQCAYWAGITHLEETGLVPRDRSHTPREYLHLIRSAAPGENAARVAPAAALTGSVERFWYGRQPAGENEFAACLDSLEELGCGPR